jgi:acetyltransferase-like isoleucine patch superfamily enzyme
MQFGGFGRHVSIRKPVCLRGMKHIFVGDRVIVKEYGWIEANPLGDRCLLRIGTGTSIGHFCHIYAARQVEVGNNILMGCGVYIADCTHGYEDISRPVIGQEARFVAPVAIGDGSWIGQHAAILGVRIGKHCVVGANSVVTEDVPDYCVVAGVPARIVKRYNPQSGEWEAVSPAPAPTHHDTDPLSCEADR